MANGRRQGAFGRQGRTSHRRGSRRQWPGHIQFFWIVGIALFFTWVAVSMAKHQFYRGNTSEQVYVSDQQ